jgi:hypothetical protein
MEEMQATDLKLKRKSIELKSYEAWLTRGKGGFHFENLKIFSQTIEAALWITRLRARGESNALSPIIKHIRLEYENLPKSFDSFKILHLSDLHIDGHSQFAQSIINKIDGMQFDLCVLTGDYRFEVHGPSHNVYFGMKKVLSLINSKYGVIGILGNHDFADEAEELERMGVKMLINESHEIRIDNESIWVAGVDDPHYYGCDDLDKALESVPEDAFRILLVHSPEIINEAAEHGISLYLCGHTHAGQICLPFIGPVIVNANCPRKYVRGVWEHGKLRGYTSAGTGSSCVPARFFCPPEIGIIELKSKMRDAGVS